MTDAYTERTIWQLKWKGLDQAQIAHLVGVGENEVARVLAGGREESQAEEDQRADA